VCLANRLQQNSRHFNGHFYSWTWVSQYQNVSILDFVGAKDDGGGGGDNWSYRIRNVPVKSSPPTNQHPVYRPECPSCRPNNSVRALKGVNRTVPTDNFETEWIQMSDDFSKIVLDQSNDASNEFHQKHSAESCLQCLVSLLLFNGTFSTKRLYRTIGVWNISCRVGGEETYNWTVKRYNKPRKS